LGDQGGPTNHISCSQVVLGNTLRTVNRLWLTVLSSGAQGF